MEKKSMNERPQTIDEIHEYFKGIIENDSFGSKMELARIYGAYVRKLESMKEEKEFKVSDKESVILVINEKLAIAQKRKGIEIEYYRAVYKDINDVYVWDTLEQAIIHGIAKLSGNKEMTNAVLKLLDLITWEE